MFDSARLRRARRVPRRARARRSFPNPSGSSGTSAPRPPPARTCDLALDDDMVEALADAMGVEVAYALLSFARRDHAGRAPRRRDPPARRRGSRKPDADARLPAARARRAAADRRSRESSRSACRPGRWPLEIARVGSAWRISCTGLRRGVTARAVPLAGARPDRGLPLRLTPGVRRSGREPGRGG